MAEPIQFILRFMPPSAEALFPDQVAMITPPQEQFMALRSAAVINKYQKYGSKSPQRKDSKANALRSSVDFEEQRLNLSKNFQWTAILGQSEPMANIGLELIYRSGCHF